MTRHLIGHNFSVCLRFLATFLSTSTRPAGAPPLSCRVALRFARTFEWSGFSGTGRRGFPAMVDVFPPDRWGGLGGGESGRAIIRVVSAPHFFFFCPRPAVKSALLLFHTWGFASLAVQPASRTHFSRGVPPNCFLGVPARLEGSDSGAGSSKDPARTRERDACSRRPSASGKKKKKILRGSRAGRQNRSRDSF